MNGQRISHYIIVEGVGEGGMGHVYKARDLKLDRFVALKFLNKDLLANGEARQRFVNEARAVSSLDHPNIATIYEIDEADDSIFISMSLCQGETLRDVLKSRRLSMDEVCHIGMQVADGLAAAHKAGIVHRDIKPANIMLLENNYVKILDFGLAKIMALPDLTTQNTILGTATYMSPEQIRGETVDYRSDIFSFGVLLHEMLSGSPPFQGEYGAAISYAIVHEQPDPVSTLRPELPVEFDAVIAKAMAKNPEERYQHVTEIVRELRKIRTCDEPESAGKVRSGGRPKRKAVLSFLVATALVLMGLLLYSNRSVFFKSAPVTTVAVMPFQYAAENGDDWLGDAISELINLNLAQYPSVRPISHEQQIAALQKMGFSGNAISTQKGIEIARRCNARKIVQGHVELIGGTLRVNAQILETTNGTVIASLTPVEGPQPRLFKIAHGLSEQLVQILEIPQEQKKAKQKSGDDPPLEALRYFLEGRTAADDLRYKESIAKMEKAIQLYPPYVKAYKYLAWSYNEIGEPEKAKEILAKEKKYIDRLSYVERLKFFADEASYDQRWKDFAAYQEKILAEEPLDAWAHFSYGWVQYQKFRQFDSGIRAIRKAIELDSTEARFYNMLGYAYLESGDKNSALETMDKSLKLRPTALNPLDSRAEIQTFVGDYDEAIATCERILAMQPDFQYARLHLALALCYKGQQSRALSELANIKRAPISKSFESDAYTTQAKICHSTGDLQLAAAALDTALSLDSGNVAALWLKGLLAIEQGDAQKTDEILALLDKVLASEGGLENRWYLYNLQGALALKSGNNASATDLFQKAVDLGPPDRDFHLERLGYAYEQMTQSEQAAIVYRAALDFNPRNAKVAYGLGRVLEELGNLDEAKRHYQESYKVWDSWEQKPATFASLAKKINDLNLTHITR